MNTRFLSVACGALVAGAVGWWAMDLLPHEDASTAPSSSTRARSTVIKQLAEGGAVADSGRLVAKVRVVASFEESGDLDPGSAPLAMMSVSTTDPETDFVTVVSTATSMSDLGGSQPLILKTFARGSDEPRATVSAVPPPARTWQGLEPGDALQVTVALH